MLNIARCILALFIELNIYQCFGYAMSKLPCIPDAKTFLQKSIYGFLGYHVLFWCLAFPCTLLNRSLNLLAALWIILLCILLLIIWIIHHSKLLVMYRNAATTAWKNKLYVTPLLIIGMLLIYYVCVNGQSDIDARTYIGEVTSMVDTGRLAGVSVISGKEIDVIRLKRSFSMFGANSAVLCRIFQVHPLTLCRTTRATINVLFFAGAALEFFRWVFRCQKDVVGQALICTMLTLGALFAFTNTIYTESRFLLYRAYEGKAYCASTLVLITILITMHLYESGDKRFFVVLFLDMLAAMSISASATFILPLTGGSIILAIALHTKKWSYIPALFLTVLPNIVYILLTVSGFAGFYLEG